jgi:DNA-binding NarL/FixJ family response regulator
VAARLYVIQDDLFFAERVRMTARRLGVEAEPISPSEAKARHWEANSVVALQVTLNPERQLELVEHLTRATPPPRVIAVTGHLETEKRSRARALGAILAAHSSMERVLARALETNAGDDADPTLRS